ncbi:astacin-like metalloprotease toxin 5 [Scomber japonicus]|uniref:astacin-like metalloprotease toxin 5 n=1 Tax=Scomber japonicus TaxID=13676 RepID=UPI0023050DB2|nr:astacin-like metalloprotease toxin 5 [Scomber japonicus]
MKLLLFFLFCVSTGGVSLNDKNENSNASGSVTSVEGKEADAETLEELNHEVIVLEGDIIMPEDRNAVQQLWANAVVPFTISPDLADRASNIFAAFKMISDVTCIRFKRRTNELNYLKFLSGKGCASFVGVRGGAQSLYYGRTCSVGNLCHEIIHSLGLHHEHTRQDRDQYITVNWDHIKQASKKNFKKKPGDTLNLPYDVDSIMHYGPYFFSKDGGPTMLAKQGTDHMGQRNYLSLLDIQRLNTLYRCGQRGKW